MFSRSHKYLYVITARERIATVKRQFEGINNANVLQTNSQDSGTQYVIIEVDKYCSEQTLQTIERKIKALYELNMIDLAERLIVQERVVIDRA